ncbi:hypothetical protein R1sor_013958 [Riccia sorocarpa]|uniref:Uncharacterized protein n=1 Tax=Riccia sorocarpa TaxID=122646 RepID=A0ABD3HE84_9MARC
MSSPADEAIDICFTVSDVSVISRSMTKADCKTWMGLNDLANILQQQRSLLQRVVPAKNKIVVSKGPFRFVSRDEKFVTLEDDNKLNFCHPKWLQKRKEVKRDIETLLDAYGQISVLVRSPMK